VQGDERNFDHDELLCEEDDFRFAGGLPPWSWAHLSQADGHARAVRFRRYFE
jgi:hypothetical protein